MGSYPRVLQVESLAGFEAEMEGGATLRLNQSQQGMGLRGGIPKKRLAVDLMGVNVQDEIVWLHYSNAVAWLPEQGAMFPQDQAIIEGISRIYEVVKARLEAVGYVVRAGRYGVPKEIEPLKGEFECVEWVKVAWLRLRERWMVVDGKRFVLIEDDERFRATDKVRWWWDTARPLTGSCITQPFVAVQCYLDEDPNERENTDSQNERIGSDNCSTGK